MAKHTASGDRWERQRKRILDRDGWRCQHCGKELAGSDATVDHLEPVSHNPGQHHPDSMLRALCRRCNSHRGDQPLRRAEYHNPDWLPHGLPD